VGEDIAVTVVQQESWGCRQKEQWKICRHGISSFPAVVWYVWWGRQRKKTEKGDLGEGLTIHRQPILVPTRRRPKLAQMEQGHTSEIDPKLGSSPHSPFCPGNIPTCAGFHPSAQGEPDESERGEEDPTEDGTDDANAEDGIGDIVMCFVMTSFQREPGRRGGRGGLEDVRWR
jgi:hypothetical protein